MELTIATNTKFENPELRKITTQISQVGASIRQNFYKLAVLLAKVERDRLYVDDGFLSTQEYAEKTFGIKKTLTYNLLAVADTYTDENGKESNLPHTGTKDYSSSQMAVLITMDEDTVRGLAKDEEITPQTSVRELKKIAKKYNPESEETGENEESEEAGENEESEEIPVIHYEWEIRCYKDENNEDAIEVRGEVPEEIANFVNEHLLAVYLANSSN